MKYAKSNKINYSVKNNSLFDLKKNKLIIAINDFAIKVQQ